MKIAYLILAHKNPEQLFRLVRALAYRDVEFFIHIDKKCTIKPFINSLSSLENQSIYFIKDRRAVRRVGAYSQTECIIRSLFEIFSKQRDFDYLILLSGQDYPIKNNGFIQAFFNKNKGKEFVKQFPIDSEKELNWRSDRYLKYYFDDFGSIGRLLGRGMPNATLEEAFSKRIYFLLWLLLLADYSRVCGIFSGVFP